MQENPNGNEVRELNNDEPENPERRTFLKALGAIVTAATVVPQKVAGALTDGIEEDEQKKTLDEWLLKQYEEISEEIKTEIGKHPEKSKERRALEKLSDFLEEYYEEMRKWVENSEEEIVKKGFTKEAHKIVKRQLYLAEMDIIKKVEKKYGEDVWTVPKPDFPEGYSNDQELIDLYHWRMLTSARYAKNELLTKGETTQITRLIENTKSEK